MSATLRVSAILVFGSLALTACSTSDLFSPSGTGSDVTTSSVAQTQAQKIDPACGNLALDIDTLRRDGVAEKVEKAAAKKYTMKAADLAKANQLNKANAEFQARCSTLPRTAAQPASAAPAATPSAAAAAGKAAAPAVKAVVPAAKSAAASAVPGVTAATN